MDDKKLNGENKVSEYSFEDVLLISLAVGFFEVTLDYRPLIWAKCALGVAGSKLS